MKKGPVKPLLNPPDIGRFLSPSSKLLYTPTTEHEGVWSEKVGDTSPWTDVVSNQQSSTTLVVEVPAANRRSFLSRVLGYSYVGKDHRLKRVLPLAHPFYEFLRCRRVLDGKGLRFTGRPPVPAEDLGANFPRPHYAEYQLYRAVLQFEAVPFACKTDEETGNEYERYVYTRSEPGYETLIIQGDNFRFDPNTLPAYVSGNLGISPPAWPGGKAVPLPVGTVLSTWYEVPLKYITDENGVYRNIAACIGRINAKPMFGYKRYTLLCEAPQIELVPHPLPPEVTTESEFLANITFRFSYFEPKPLGYLINGNLAPQLGHNMAMFRGDRRWYPASLAPPGEQPDGFTRLFQAIDFGVMFKSARDPNVNLEPEA